MRRILLALSLMLTFLGTAALADDASAKAAQSSIDAQIKAFIADDNALAYSYAAPNVKKIFPTLDIFMNMVTRGYQPVQKPLRYSFGKSEWTGANAVAQQVFLIGPDGKDYEAVYTLELQPDGVWRITGVTFREAKTVST